MAGPPPPNFQPPGQRPPFPGQPGMGRPGPPGPGGPPTPGQAQFPRPAGAPGLGQPLFQGQPQPGGFRPGAPQPGGFLQGGPGGPGTPGGQPPRPMGQPGGPMQPRPMPDGFGRLGMPQPGQIPPGAPQPGGPQPPQPGMPPMQRPALPPHMRPHAQSPSSPNSPNAPLVDPATGRVPANFIPPVSGTPPPPVSTAPPGSRASRRAYPQSDPYGGGAAPQNLDPFSAQQQGGSPDYGRPQTPMSAGAPQLGGPQGGPQAPQFFTPGDPQGPSFAPQQGGQFGGQQAPSFAPPGGQFGAQVPSFGGAPPPQHQQQHTQGQWGGQPAQLQTGDSMGNLAGNFGNMSMGPGQPQGPAAVNLLAGPPLLTDLDAPSPVSWVPPQSSVSQAPTSNTDPKYKRCTMNAIPQTTAMLAKSRIPMGLLITPYRHLLNGEEPVPVINPPQIVRCRRCRTYINPWVQFVEQGTRWKCNLCFLSNEVPTFFDWDPETRAHVDRMKRPELTHAVVEFIAPQEYMVRPPQPVVMLFVIDVSYSAVQSGMVATAARTILDTLDAIPNTDNRTKVGFITVDSSLHFYNLNPNLSEPQMLIVSDLDDTFLPMPYDLLVSLSESRAVIESLLQRLGDMFKSTQCVQNVLGRALQAAHKMISPIGGKIIVLQSTLPNTNDGALKPREDPKLLGTPKEVTLLQPQNPFYKNLAVTCSPTQVSIDVFLFSAQYADVATLSGCAKFTGGSVYFYPNFNAARPDDAMKFANELSHFLSRPIGLEAVMRVRASKGIRMTAFHGNFFLRSTDLLSLPNVSPDNSYAVEMTLIENLTTSLACFQTALLHTSSNGERRIRVLTLAVPVTNNLSDVFGAADQFAISALLAKKGVERALTSKIEDAREALQYKLHEIMAAYKQSFTTSSQATQLLLPENLKLLPLLTLGMLKNTAFRATSTVPSDLRSYIMALLYVFPPELCITHTHPRFYALHVLEPQAGLPGEDGQIMYPPRLNLSSEKLERHGLYLLENGVEMFLWVGRAVAPELCKVLFDKPSYEGIVPGKTTLPTLSNDYSTRVNNLIGKIREVRIQMATCYPHLYVVKEDGDPALRMWFLSQLIEDRIDASYSYPQFLGVMREQMGKISAS